MNDVIGPVDYGTLSYRCERGRYFAGNFSSVFGWYSFEFEWKNLKKKIKKNKTFYSQAGQDGWSDEDKQTIFWGGPYEVKKEIMEFWIFNISAQTVSECYLFRDQYFKVCLFVLFFFFIILVTFRKANLSIVSRINLIYFF